MLTTSAELIHSLNVRKRRFDDVFHCSHADRESDVRREHVTRHTCRHWLKRKKGAGPRLDVTDDAIGYHWRFGAACKLHSQQSTQFTSI